AGGGACRRAVPGHASGQREGRQEQRRQRKAAGEDELGQGLAGPAECGQHGKPRIWIRRGDVGQVNSFRCHCKRRPRDSPGPAVSGAAGGRGTGGIPPGLHLVAVPIGAARDITLRALDVLAGADVLAAEDTRTLRHLMEIHGLPLNGRPLVAYHDHNEGAALPRLMAALREGKSVAYAPEAGTPLVSDPGFGLARAAAAEGIAVLAAPGASAVLTA